MQLCLGTSLAIMVPTTLRSYRRIAPGNPAPRACCALWVLPAIAGAAVGSAVAAVAPAGFFKAAFAAIGGLIAAKLLFGQEGWVLGGELPNRPAMTAYGFLIGLGSSLMGIAGGSLGTIVLTLYRRPIHEAVATAAGLGVPITLTGAIGYALAGLRYPDLLPPLSVGFVSAIGVVLIAPVSSYVAPFGARLAHRLSRRSLEFGFGLFLLLAAARFLIGALAG